MFFLVPFCSCFFFQAEDGIRDYKVTGVQTCALPILAATHADLRPLSGSGQSLDGSTTQAYRINKDYEEIGRASCRERV